MSSGSNRTSGSWSQGLRAALAFCPESRWRDPQEAKQHKSETWVGHRTSPCLEGHQGSAGTWESWREEGRGEPAGKEGG